MVDKVLFQSMSHEWETPQWLYDLLDGEFHFVLDPCATDDNAKCYEYYTAEEDGLSQPWAPSTTFVNPPYGRQVGKWVQKAYEESLLNGAIVVMLLPIRSDTLWWHDFVMHADEMRFINGRLRFGGAKNVAPFPSVVVVFRPGIMWAVPMIGESISARGRKL